MCHKFKINLSWIVATLAILFDNMLNYRLYFYILYPPYTHAPQVPKFLEVLMSMFWRTKDDWAYNQLRPASAVLL